MLPINKKLTPHNFTTMYGKKNLYIVVHYVGAVSTAANNAAYFANNRVDASAHYFVDEASIWQSVEDCNKAWHCGGGLQGSGGHSFYNICTNSNSIGIEMCVKKDGKGWYYEEKTLENTLDLVRYLMDKHNIPVSNVIRHYDVTGKLCPALYTDDNMWQEFKNMIEEEIDMKELEKLQNQINEQTTTIAEMGAVIMKLSNPMIYNYVDENMPDWAREAVKKAANKGVLRGNGEGLDLTYADLKFWTYMDRFGMLD